jgi:hypothetical protein
MILPQVGQRWLRFYHKQSIKLHYILEVVSITKKGAVNVEVIVDFDSNFEYRAGYQYESNCLSEMLESHKINEEFTYLKGQDKV